MPTLFIPHGGGPCFFMDPAGGPPDPMWRPMQAYLAGLIDSLPERPRAILLVSGHWETPAVTVHTGEHPALLYDYGGFPPHTYQLRWDAPGAPDVARRAAALLDAASDRRQAELDDDGAAGDPGAAETGAIAGTVGISPESCVASERGGRSPGADSAPRTAVAAATTGETRWVRPPFP